jgi:hypothetical protein
VQNHWDPVEDALASLGGRRWPKEYDNIQLKDKIMNSVQTKQSGSSLRRRPALAATLALLVLGSAGFAAAGGIQMIKGLIVTVEVEGVDGSITVDMAKADIQTDGDMTTITLDRDDLDIDGDIGDGAKITITATSDGGMLRTVMDADGNVIQTTPVNASSDDQ